MADATAVPGTILKESGTRRLLTLALVILVQVGRHHLRVANTAASTPLALRVRVHAIPGLLVKETRVLVVRHHHLAIVAILLADVQWRSSGAIERGAHGSARV